MEGFGRDIDFLEEQRISLGKSFVVAIMVLNYVNRIIVTAKAEKLFDMPMSEYAEFAQCKQDYEGMKHVYALYKHQKIAVNNWGKILWSFLNPNQLIEGIEVYMKDFNKLDKAVCVAQ